MRLALSDARQFAALLASNGSVMWCSPTFPQWVTTVLSLRVGRPLPWAPVSVYIADFWNPRVVLRMWS